MEPSLLSTPAVDYCQKNSTSGLRGRRFSSNLPALPSNLFGNHVLRDDSSSAVVDVVEDEALHRIDETPPLPSPLSNVYMSGYSTNVYIPRHQGTGTGTTLPGPSLTATPASEFPPSTPVDRSGSIIELIGGEPAPKPGLKLERVKRRLACAYFLFFLCGWGDGVTGTILPYLKSQFNLSDILVSALYCGSTVGFFLGTSCVESIIHTLGRYRLDHSPRRSFIPAWLSLFGSPAKGMGYSASQARYITLIIASVLHSSFFVLMGIRQGYPAMFIAYAAAAFSRSLLTASLNEFLASGPKEAMGYGYGLWSLGGAFAPLVCQAIIASGAPWPNFYYGSLVVSAINLAIVSYSFKPTRRERLAERKEAMTPGTPTDEENKEMALSSAPSSSTTLATPENTFRRALLGVPLAWCFYVFGWLYCGSETTTQGFTVSYLLAARHANPKTVGYVTSGFAGGLSAGRFLWGYFSRSLTFTQRKHVVQACMVVALVMHLLVWFIDSNVENSVSAGIIGLMYGPIWPSSLTMISEVLPPDVRMMAMAIYGAAGNLGTSVFPLILGAVSSSSWKGFQTLPYLDVPLIVVELCIWAFLFPSKLTTQVLRSS